MSYLSTMNKFPSACARSKTDLLKRLSRGVTPVALIVSIAFTGLFGCEDEPPILAKIGDAQPMAAQVADAEPVPEVPRAAIDIFKDLPYPPEQILRKPGDAVGNLRVQLPKLTQDTPSSRFLTEHRTDGPFTTIVYQLDKTLRVVEAVSATFHEAYMHPAQYSRVRKNMADRLGEGEELYEHQRKGQVWRNLDYRIELHIDTAVNDLVLLFHHRGKEDLKRLKKSTR